MTSALRDAAARNNAEWCDVVCRTHGISGAFHADAWVNARRTPPLYPDAVTLTPTANVERLLARIDSSPGCSIKDSFANLDLTEHGFRILFDAQWIMRTPSTPTPAPASSSSRLRWQPVHDAHELAAWAQAWDPDVHGLFRPALLDHDAVTVLAAFRDDKIVAGAIANVSQAVVGVSNTFSTAESPDDAWTGGLAYLTREHPDLTVVGYESGDALVAARAHGFTTLGPLRIWIRER